MHLGFESNPTKDASADSRDFVEGTVETELGELSKKPLQITQKLKILRFYKYIWQMPSYGNQQQ